MEDGAEPYAILDTSNTQWREDLRVEILKDGDKDTAVEIDEEDDNDTPQHAPAITTVKEALKAANQLGQFADYRGNEELSFAIAKVTNLLLDLKLKSAKQSNFTSFF